MVSFRKSKSFGPFRITASKSGLSVSAGIPGLRYSVNTKGQARRTVSIPGTGIYQTDRIDGRRRAAAPRTTTVTLDGPTWRWVVATVINLRTEEGLSHEEAVDKTFAIYDGHYPGVFTLDQFRTYLQALLDQAGDED